MYQTYRMFILLRSLNSPKVYGVRLRNRYNALGTLGFTELGRCTITLARGSPAEFLTQRSTATHRIRWDEGVSIAVPSPVKTALKFARIRSMFFSMAEELRGEISVKAKAE